MSGRAPVLALLHTSPAHIATFAALAATEGVGVRLRHLVREDLLARARVEGPEAVAEDVAAAIVSLDADAVLCTCSTIGGVAELVGDGRVLRVDRPMATAAVTAAATGAGPIVVLAALASTVDPTLDLLAEEAGRAHHTPELEARLVPDAWDRFAAGDLAGYHALVAAAAADAAAAGAAVVVLAQVSMAPAAALARVDVPVLSSPRLGLLAAVVRVEGSARPGTQASAEH